MIGRRSNLVMVAFIASTLGCASRTVPASLPAESPASPSADEAKPETVTLALQEDPPLPGEPTEHWPGLHPTSEPASGGHEHHEHHDHKEHHKHQDHHDHHAAPPVDHSGHGDSAPKTDQPPKHDSKQSPDKAIYSCPMHPEIVSDRAGRCPKCGMNLERKQ